MSGGRGGAVVGTGSSPCLAAACFASGCAALVYEVVWFQRLQLVLGSSTVSLGVLLATFMGGMGIGSLLAARVVPSRWHPLVAFAAIEAGIATCGLMLHALVPLAGGVYASLSPEGGLGVAARAVVSAICLLPPTILMGATLPTLAREAVAMPAGFGRIGFLQGANLAGGVAGCLLSALILLPQYDVATATMVAMLLNAVAAGLALLPERRPTSAATVGAVAPTRFTTVHAAIAASGLTALASELIWTRLLALQFGGTVYTFALILAGFLAGLGLGNLAGVAIAAGPWAPRVALGWCQMLLVAAMAWAAHQIAGSLPYWPIDPALARSPAVVFQLDLVRCLWVVLPAAILWGASFPLAVAAAAAGSDHDAARVVGCIAGANTIGGIMGALGAGVLLVAWLGSQAAQQAMMAVAAGAGVLLVAAVRRPVAAATLAGAIAAAAILVRSTPPIPGQLVGYGRHSAAWDGRGEFLYVGEGLQASVAVSRSPLGRLHYHNAGKVQASSEPQDMRLQRMLGHLTTLVIERPRNVLVIGCGAGVTAGAVALDPRVERATIVEIEPLVPRSVAAHFGPHNHRVLDDPRVRVRIDDARHHLIATRETFDAITSDPLDPWVKGAAALFTEEFLSAVRGRLEAGGVFTMFVQLYETSEPAVKSQLATFFRVFPDGVVFTNTQFGRGYDLVLLGRTPAAPIDVDAVEARLAAADMAAVAASLREVGIGSAVELLATVAGTAADLAPWLEGAAINRDSNLRLQYLAGLGLNLRDAADIHSRLLEHPFRFPQTAFTGSPDRLEALRAAVVRERGR